MRAPRRFDSQLTQIAEIAAERNEDLTIANGTLQGEKRAAVARLIVVALFAISAEVVPRLHGHATSMDVPRLAAMIAYLAFAVGCFFASRRPNIDPRRALVRPAVFTLADFAFVATLGGVEIAHGDGLNEPLTVAFEAVLIAFTVVRARLWHVALAVSSAVAVFSTLAAFDGRFAVESIVFVNAGFAGLGTIVALTNRAVRTMFDELRHRDNLSRFLPQQVAERLLAEGPAALAPVQREVTVLFSDIREFTKLSEGLEPRAVLALLDDYYGRMAQVIKGHDGVVGKFMGDGILAFWNVPDPDPKHATKAVRAAIDMLRALEQYNRERIADSLPVLRIGIGIHTGTVAAGMLGGGGQAEYTVIGDAVNVASRVETLTKTLGAAILITEPTQLACAGRFSIRRVGREEIRGRQQPITVFAVDLDDMFVEDAHIASVIGSDQR